MHACSADQDDTKLYDYCVLHILIWLLLDDSAAMQRRRNRQDALKSYYSLADEPTAPSSAGHGTTSVTG